MSNKDTVMRMIAGLDIGNGYVKGYASTNGNAGSSIDFPSCVAIQTNDSDIRTRIEEAGPVLDDIFNEMAATFDSPTIESHTMRLFGNRGVNSGKSMDEFDVASPITKARQDLSAILVLGSLAGKAIQDYYKETGTLPTEHPLVVEANFAIALPISEYKDYRKEYAARFRDYVHMVTIHNFELPVRVEIHVSDVRVMAEGASAQFAITEKGVDQMELMLKELRSRGESFEGITAQDILNAQNTLGIDIGEGTVNFPVFQDGRFNPDASSTFAQGYGSVLENAAERLQRMGSPFGSRKKIAKLLLNGPSPLKRAQYNMVVNIVNEELEAFTGQVEAEFRKILAKVGAFTEVVYVYGGGANAAKEQLYPRLIRVAKSMSSGEEGYPILYLNSEYSRYLNQEGLYSIAKHVAEMANSK